MQNTLRYKQIVAYFSELIDAGKMREGEKIPTESEICNMFNVSRTTVRAALNVLCQNGYIYKIQGKGSFVFPKQTDMQLNHLCGFSEEMRRLGYVPSTQLISYQLLSPSSHVAEQLMLGAGQKAYMFERLRLADDAPMALEKVYLPFHRFPGLESKDLSSSLYKLLDKEYGCQRSRAEQSLRADFADKYTAGVLDLKSGMPVLRIRRVTFDSSGMPFEYVESTYRGDKYVFNVSLGI